MNASNFNYVIIVINRLNQKEEVMGPIKITPKEAKKIYYAYNPIEREEDND